MPSTGARILVQGLHAHGVDTIFCVAGESYLPVLDAVLDYPDIRVITCRHESGATFMAEAYASLTGKPGVAFVTRGPGACNASIGIHTAHQSSTPVLLFVGLINTADKDREAFQDFDLPQMYGSLSKWSTIVCSAQRMADYLERGFNTAQTGRPGPVVMGLPEEVLTGTANECPTKTVNVSQPIPSPANMSSLKDILKNSDRPVILVGGSLWTDEDCGILESFCDQAHMPVVSALRRQDIFNHRNPSYIGELGFGPNPELIKYIKSADVILVIGTRLDEITTQGYTLFESEQKLIHIYPAPEEFGKVYPPDLAIQSHIGPFIKVLTDLSLENGSWEDWRDKGRKQYEAWTHIQKDMESRWNGADMTQIFRQLRDLLPSNSIVTTDAGNFSGWCQRYLYYGRPGRKLAPVSGAMGYAVPSAVAASLRHPDRTVLGVCGDGGFMMTGHELATAVHHGAKPIIMVCNNNMYGTIRMHQERDFPGRISGTSLTNPDFIKLGQSYGCYAAVVEDARDFKKVWESALDSDTPALIEVAMDPRQISTQSKP